MNPLKINSYNNFINQFLRCSICLLDYEEDESIRFLPCCHKFHAKCIDTWLLNKNSLCPVNRFIFKQNII